MKTEKTTLEIGDVIYSEDFGNLNKMTIDRVTKTQAITKRGRRFKREIGNFIRTINRQAFGPHYSLETPELKEKYHRQNLMRFIKNASLSEATTPDLENIAMILRNEK